MFSMNRSRFAAGLTATEGAGSSQRIDPLLDAFRLLCQGGTPHTTAAADPGTVVGLDQVQEAVLVGIGHRTGDGRRCCEAPAEQSAVVLAKPLRIGANDLEVHYWISHESPSATVMSQLPSMITAIAVLPLMHVMSGRQHGALICSGRRLLGGESGVDR
jgi:hypothetical protein